MKKRLSLILVVAIIFSSVVFTGISAVDNPQSTTIGDVNYDAKINFKDCLVLRLYLRGDAPEINLATADINADASVDMADILLLRQHLVRTYSIIQRPVGNFPIALLMLDGVSITNYDIIIPENSDVYTEYAASLFSDYVKDYSGVTLDILDDTAPVTPYEILIGETNRSESTAAITPLADDEYILKKSASKLVLLGNDYMIGAGVGKLTHTYMAVDDATSGNIVNVTGIQTTNTPAKYQALDAESVILMIGDGMGSNHLSLTASRLPVYHPELNYQGFAALSLPNKGACTTRSLTTIASGGVTPTDSAAAGTALATGYKTENYRLGQDKNGNNLLNIRELAASQGRKTGVMSTETQAGATPAAFTVHTEARSDLSLILNLQSQLTNIDYLKGEVGDELLSETIAALDLLSTDSPNGFFTMIEEAYTDVYSHYNQTDEMTLAVYRFNTAIQYAMTFCVCNPDTVLIVTADHETGGISNGAFTTTVHTTKNVPVFAIGDGTELFNGSTVDNIDIAKFIARTFGVSSFGQ